MFVHKVSNPVVESEVSNPVVESEVSNPVVESEVSNIIISLQNSKLIRKFEHSLSELMIQDYSKKSEINANWRGFEAYRAWLTYKSGSSVEKILGQGFGTLIDLGFVMPLGGNKMQMIPITHNAYMYILLKFGVVGFLLYGFFLVSLMKNKKMFKMGSAGHDHLLLQPLMTSIAWVLLLTTFVISGVFNLFQLDAVLILLGSLLYSVLSDKPLLSSRNESMS